MTTDRLLSSKWSHFNKSDYLSSQLSVMLMMRRLVYDWLPISTAVARFSKPHKFLLGKARWPTISDLEGAARAVMRSQMTYGLSTAMLVQGVQSNVLLPNVTGADCLEIARQYFLKERFSEAIEWLQQAIVIGDFPSKETLLYYKAVALCFSGDGINSRNITSSLLKENPLSKPPNYLIDYFSIMGIHGCTYPEARIYHLLNLRYIQSGVDVQGINFYRNTTSFERHSRLCRGEDKPSSRLACRYVHYHRPHLRFQPFKLEELQLNPPVVRFYDLVSDDETEYLIRQAKHIMKPANVGKGSEMRTTEYRSSLVAWLNPTATDWLTRRISEATNLNANLAEHHQISRYSVAGEYLPHVDFFGNRTKWTDDRMATVMFYLNDVAEGGRTVFTRWGLSVPPVRNSAVLWFNYAPSGEGDLGSQHSGCPVLRGTKWVLNKWIHNGGNHVHFPCTLDKQGSFSGFYL